MRTFVKMAMALGLAACLGTSANAQGPGRGMGMGGGGGINLLTNKSVQKELKLSEEQIEKATTAATEMREKMTEKRKDLQGLEGEEMREKMTAMMKEMATESKKLTDGILKPEQSNRLEQISLQQQGFRAFATPEIQSKLKMTDEQKNKIKDLMEESQGQMREIFQSAQGGGDRAEMMKKMAEFNKATNEKATALLTDDQKKSWKDMTGEAFTIVQEPGRRPGAN